MGSGGSSLQIKIRITSKIKKGWEIRTLYRVKVVSRCGHRIKKFAFRKNGRILYGFWTDFANAG